MRRMFTVFSVLLLLMVGVGAAEAQEGVITTIAGNGTRGYCGDGVPATESCFYEPWGLDVDSEGNVYVADRYNNRIRMIDRNGIITTVAGTGVAGFSGDGGPATQATFNKTTSVVVNPEGGFYFTDHYGHRIRKVDANGIITTYAGSGVGGYCGDGGPAISACLHYPDGMALDNQGNLYFADGWNARVRKIDTNGIITTFAGNGSGSYCGEDIPATQACIGAQGVAVDSDGTVFLGEYVGRIWKVDEAGIARVVAGTGTMGYCGDGGPAIGACFLHLWRIGVDPDDNLVASDTNNCRLRKIDAAGIINTEVGSGICGYSGDGGPALGANIYWPFETAWDGEVTSTL